MESIPSKIVPLNEESKIKLQMEQQQRSIKLFESAIKSEFTKKNYRCTLKKFTEFYKISDYDAIIALPEKEIQVMLEDYVMHLKTQNISPNTFPIMFTSLQLFFSMNDKILNWKKIKKFFPTTVKKSGFRSYGTEHIQLLLKVTTDLRNRAIILFLSSTGARVGSLEGLRMKHIKDIPVGCKRVMIYADSKEEYMTFLTPESTKALDAYIQKRRNDGELITPESPVFRDKYDVKVNPAKPLDYMGIKEVIKRILKKSGLAREKTGMRYDIQICHGFRKRFNTVLKSNGEINSNITEKLMGHKNGLDGVYFVPSEEQCFAEFRKLSRT